MISTSDVSAVHFFTKKYNYNRQNICLMINSYFPKPNQSIQFWNQYDVTQKEIYNFPQEIILISSTWQNSVAYQSRHILSTAYTIYMFILVQ